MAKSFTPVEELLLYCRFCRKTIPATLERGIAGSGRTVDMKATFEYICKQLLLGIQSPFIAIL